MEIALLSDTHIPDQADHVPEEFSERIQKADHVIHAGDFCSEAALGEIADDATGLTAVYGNADPGTIDLPAVASVTTGETTFVVSHGMINFVERAVSSSEGVVFDREDWLDAVSETARARADPDDTVVGIAGHSHEVENEVSDGVRVLNPGSATGVGPADGRATMMTVNVTDTDIEVTVHEQEIE